LFTSAVQFAANSGYGFISEFNGDVMDLTSSSGGAVRMGLLTGSADTAHGVTPNAPVPQTVVAWCRMIAGIVRPTESHRWFGGPHLDESRLRITLHNAATTASARSKMRAWRGDACQLPSPSRPAVPGDWIRHKGSAVSIDTYSALNQ